MLETFTTFKCKAHDHRIERHWCLLVLHLVQPHQQRGHEDLSQKRPIKCQKRPIQWRQQPLTASGTASWLRRRGGPRRGGGLLVNNYSNIDKICNTAMISNNCYTTMTSNSYEHE